MASNIKIAERLGIVFIVFSILQFCQSTIQVNILGTLRRKSIHPVGDFSYKTAIFKGLEINQGLNQTSVIYFTNTRGYT